MNAPSTIDYISIDAEGSDLAILEGINQSQNQFRRITVEHNFTAQREEIQSILEGRDIANR